MDSVRDIFMGDEKLASIEEELINAGPAGDNYCNWLKTAKNNIKVFIFFIIITNQLIL